MNNKFLILLAGTTLLTSCSSINNQPKTEHQKTTHQAKTHEEKTSHESSGHSEVSNKVIAEQRHLLAKNTENKGYGPQAPRDIDLDNGTNRSYF